ncbi:10372_t:CDS:2 [Ambispora gerdemannii]|uniref:10372_t:CDS:1 n=1 Tax=Ambispora gerdemannii TaxID=144530 RepID=A0A9N9F1F8_9GLOM|nr:10372_t:CDS:2 [Ambispora gerdemannii]
MHNVKAEPKVPTTTPAVAAAPGGPAPQKTPGVSIDTRGKKILSAIGKLRADYGGDAIKSGLDGLEKMGVKDDIENGINKIDPDTPEERKEEEKKITHRIYKLDLAITYLLYYTSLVLNWLTLLGSSKSVDEFFYEVFIGSFDFTEWDFNNFNIIGKISGVTCSLQIVFFVLANLIVFGITFLHPNGKQGLPENLRAPIYYGGPFQLIHLMKPTLKKYHLSVKRIDAQFSQILGILSQLFIIVAASIVTNTKLDDIAYLIDSNPQIVTPVAVDTGLNYLVTRQLDNNTASNVNATELTIAVQHAALFTKTTLIVSTVGITMTAFLNILAWISNVWRVNQKELIIYEAYKIEEIVPKIITEKTDNKDTGSSDIGSSH